MNNLTCEEIIDEIKALYARHMPETWIEVSITSWKEFDDQGYGSRVVSVDADFQKHELRCAANNGTIVDKNGRKICGTDLSETGKTIHEALTHLLKSSQYLLKQDICIFEY